MRSMEERISKAIKQLALEAGKVIFSARESGQFLRSTKNDNPRDWVTEVDLQVDRLAADFIQQSFPGHHILSEELNPNNLTPGIFEEPTWIVDPIDGTNDFFRGLPNVAFSIAYMEHHALQCGFVNAPFLEEIYEASKGKGARLNGKLISPSQNVNLTDAMVASGITSKDCPISDRELGRLKNVLEHCGGYRRLGSAAINCCYVACGRLDGYFENVFPWDIAAGRLIASEAGAEVFHLLDSPQYWPWLPSELRSDSFVVASPTIAKVFRELLLTD